MLEFLKRRLKSDKGAMDKILVTLLLVVIAMVAVAGLGTWMTEQTDSMISQANTAISNATSN